jgi:hypothetical protein
MVGAETTGEAEKGLHRRINNDKCRISSNNLPFFPLFFSSQADPDGEIGVSDGR